MGFALDEVVSLLWGVGRRIGSEIGGGGICL